MGLGRYHTVSIERIRPSLVGSVRHVAWHSERHALRLHDAHDGLLEPGDYLSNLPHLHVGRDVQLLLRRTGRPVWILVRSRLVDS